MPISKFPKSHIRIKLSPRCHRSDNVFSSHAYNMQMKLFILQVIKEKKKTYFENKAKGIIPPTLEELTRSPDDVTDPNVDTKTLADNVFKGLRDDLDFNDENDVGKRHQMKNNTNRGDDKQMYDEIILLLIIS